MKQGGRRGSRTLKAVTLDRFRGGCHRQLACPSVFQSSGGRDRTSNRLLNRELPYRWATPDHFSQDGRTRTDDLVLPGHAEYQTFPRPEWSERPAGVEPAHPPWQGDRLPLHHGRVWLEAELSKSQEHRVGLEPTSPHYGCGVLAAERPVRVCQWDHRDLNPDLSG